MIGGACSSDASRADDGEGGEDAAAGPTSDAGGATDSGGGGQDATLPDAGPAVPTLTKIDPTTVPVGALGPTLVVTGMGFSQASIVQLDGVDQQTTFVSPTELRMTMPTNELKFARVIQITVHAAGSGGGTSAPLPFTVENPVPTLTTLSPTSALVGSPQIALTVAGQNFAQGAQVFFGTTELVVILPGASSIKAMIPPSLMLTAGVYDVTVKNGGPGGGTTSKIGFVVTNPTDIVISQITPSFATAGSGSFTLTVDGSGFVATSVISFNGTALQTTFVSANKMTAIVPASLLTAVGDFPVTVSHVQPMGGTSVSLPATFQVRNPPPVLSSASPNTLAYGGGDAVVTLNGSGFVPTSIAKIGTSDLVTTFVNPTQIRATVPGSLLGALGTHDIFVVNPAPGGGTSGTVTLYVVCDGTGVDVVLTAVGAPSTFQTNFASPQTPQAPRVYSQACPTSLSSTNQPVRTWVVQNTMTSPVLLSVWAVCTGDADTEDDGFLAFYRRATPPATDDERKACAPGTVVSEGEYGSAGDYRSPESNGSNWCPGLTKANGGALQLGVCERAVVYGTPYSVTSTRWTPYPQVRIQADAP